VNKRIKRINELIKRELGKIISRDIEIPEGSLLTITDVETTNDLKQAKIWISIYPFQKSKQVFKILSKKINQLQFSLNKKLNFRSLPRISFKIDQTEERASKIENVFKNFS